MAAVLLPTVQPTLDTLAINMDAYHSAAGNANNHARPSASPRSLSQGTTSLAYRGLTAVPVQPYAFQQTPQLRQAAPAAYRVPPAQSQIGRLAYPASASSTSTASTSSSSNPSLRAQYNAAMMGKTDPAMLQHQYNRGGLSASSSTPDLLLRSPQDEQMRNTPDRYRNMQRRTASSSGSPGGQVQDPSRHSTVFAPDSSRAPSTLTERPPHLRTVSTDDSLLTRSQAAGRYRRRSAGTLEAATQNAAPSRISPDATTQQPVSAQLNRRPEGVIPTQISGIMPIRPGIHQRTDSSNSNASSSSSKRPSSARQMSSDSAPGAPSSPRHSPNNSVSTARTAGTTPNARMTAPSPLSRPMTAGTETSTKRASQDSSALPPSSPAAAQLAALSEKDLNRGVKSRLRRAFSFGSSQELKKASGEATTPAERARMRRDENATELSPEDAAVAAKQEASGLGTQIYTGQGAVFGSTDNLSISSTASSASIMLRKMGRGAKKSARSLKGLFRPKSVIGAPAADPSVAPATTTAEVSLVTVEAERERSASVVASAAPQLSLDLSSPTRIDPMSSDGKRPMSQETAPDNKGSWGRKSVAASDIDRADVLNAVRTKGILKRSVTDTATFASLPNTMDLLNRSVSASAGTTGTSTGSAPGTPDVNTVNAPGFAFANRQASSSTRSLPGGQSLRNISFSPRIQLHDVWSATEYDRRGDVATCNRLTPMLAQQIKEELNTFKMEMEVHEMSKPYTHFF